MIFDKVLMFLGMVAEKMKDGTIYYVVTLFDQASGETLKVNVLESRTDDMKILAIAQFGQPLHVELKIREVDKNVYKFRLHHVDVVEI